MRQRALLPVLFLMLAACSRGAAPDSTPGVDLLSQTVSVGVLNDETGPVSAVGRPWGAGLRILARQINAGHSSYLPPGWKLNLVERDHAYDPRRSVALFGEIQKDVLFIATSFGTPNTLPLQPLLERSRIVAFPASLSSALHNSQYTPPIGPSYKVEVARALDWMTRPARKGQRVPPVKLGLIYQKDEYGADGLAAVDTVAPALGIEVVSRQSYAAGQSEFGPIVAALKKAGATHVILTTMPSATAPILAAAEAQQYRPVWVGNSPAWLDRFYDATLVPPQIFANFYWANSFAYWGEDVPMMKGFLEAYERYGREVIPPDNYILAGYAAGLLEMQVLTRTIRSGDLTREGFLRALRATRDYDTYGAVAQPLDFTTFPYVTGTRSRILKPDFTTRSWIVAGDYAEPRIAPR